MEKAKIKLKMLVVYMIAMLLSSTYASCQEQQEIIISDFPATGLILDIGGGGEGVIGQLKGDQVISIDINERELIDAPSKNLKIVMDARDLKFIDNSFNTAVIFYTLMYIKGIDHEKVFNEVYRVLKHNGKLIIWDVNLPARTGSTPDNIAYYFKFQLPNTTINTGYGVHRPDKEQNLQYYIDIAEKTGFEIIGSLQNGSSLYLEVQKN